MRRINQCLNPRLLDICKRTAQLEELNIKLNTYLPQTLQERCHVGSFNGGCLVIVTDNSVWASQIRYVLPEIRDKLRKEGGIYQLTSIKVTVASVDINPAPKRNNSPKLSSKARSAIIDGGYQCKYAPLRQALLNLANENKV